MNNHVVLMKHIAKNHVVQFRKQILKNVNLKVSRGDYISIYGHAGCGKSTLLLIMGMLEIPSNGEFWLDGIDVSTLSIDDAAALRNEKLGFLFKSTNLINGLNVYENVALPLRYNRITMDAEEIFQRTMLCLDRLNIAQYANHMLNELTEGQQTMVALARALVRGPELLLVDDAIDHLDSKNAKWILGVFAKLNEAGMTICFTTHNLVYAKRAKTRYTIVDGTMHQLHHLLADVAMAEAG